MQVGVTVGINGQYGGKFLSYKPLYEQRRNGGFSNAAFTGYCYGAQWIPPRNNCAAVIAASILTNVISAEA